MKCAACSREELPSPRSSSSSDDGQQQQQQQRQQWYCRYHAKALEQLQRHYGSWVDAYGDISWQDYLKRLSGMEETGQWAREVIEVEIKMKKKMMTAERRET